MYEILTGGRWVINFFWVEMQLIKIKLHSAIIRHISPSVKNEQQVMKLQPKRLICNATFLVLLHILKATPVIIT